MIDGIGSHDAAQLTQWNSTDTVDTRAQPTRDYAYDQSGPVGEGVATSAELRTFLGSQTGQDFIADNLIAPETGPISGARADAIYNELGYDPGGIGETANAALNPFDALAARGDADTAFAETAAQYPNVRNAHNNEADAFRHATWNAHMTQSIGASEAKKFGDAHERSGANPESEIVMDLMNNHNGRVLAEAFPDMDPATLIATAADMGLLQTAPIEVRR